MKSHISCRRSSIPSYDNRFDRDMGRGGGEGRDGGYLIRPSYSPPPSPLQQVEPRPRPPPKAGVQKDERTQ